MNKLVLLAEANPTDRRLLLRALGKWNLATEITVVGNGVEALEF
jgi:CheY-like chemotaxis protein